MNKITEQFICAFDRALKTLIHSAHPRAKRPYPADRLQETLFQASQKDLLTARHQMRINHTGEVCAQALYDGHSTTNGCHNQKQWLKQAREEEVEHLIWCDRRLREIGGSPSLLNPFFYGASFIMARSLSTLNPQWNMQFIRETERQVFDHLTAQKQHLSFDTRSLAIIEQMRQDEKEHEQAAANFEPESFPRFAQQAMAVTALAMKALVRWL